MNRRGFLGSIAGVAIATSLPTETVQKALGNTPLPVGADLSLTSLNCALNIGKEKDYGKPLCLTIGPENLFIARELFGRGVELVYDPKGRTNEEDLFGYRVVSALPMNFWMVQFERGTVTSQGPN